MGLAVAERLVPPANLKVVGHPGASRGCRLAVDHVLLSWLDDPFLLLRGCLQFLALVEGLAEGRSSDDEEYLDRDIGVGAAAV